MERTAADVAGPAESGADLPSFDELLAEGSFHARLARARAEREKALARAGDEREGFILDTSRKPWDRVGARPAPGAAVPPADPKVDRAADAMSVSRPPPMLPPKVLPEPPPQVLTKPAPELGAAVPPAFATGRLAMPPRPSPALPERLAQGAAAGLPAATGRLSAAPVPLRPAAVRPLPLPLPLPVQPDQPAVLPPVEALATEPVPQAVQAAPRRKLSVAAGFAAGLTLGVAAVALWPMLRPAAPPPDIAPQTGATAAAPLVPQPVPAAEPAAEPALAVQPAPATGAAVAALPAGAAQFSLSPAALAVTQPGVPALGQTELAIPAAPRPEAVIATLRSPDLPLGAPTATDAGPQSAAAPAPPPVVTIPAALALPPGAEAAPRFAALGHPARVAPARLTGALSGPRDMALPVQPLPAPFFGGEVLLNAPAGIDAAALAEVTAALEAAGFAPAETNRVSFVVSDSNVRYFYPEDEGRARALADGLGATLRDFSHYSPAPPPGTIEVWLEGRGSGRAVAAASRTRAAKAEGQPPAAARQQSSQRTGQQTRQQTRQRAAQDPEMKALRDRILDQLRDGDHL